MAGKGGSGLQLLGKWAFLIGVVLAVLFGFVEGLPAWVLVIIGLIVGLLNVQEKETSQFLTAGTILVLVGYLGGQVLDTVPFLGPIFDNLLTLFAPAVIVVAVKSVFSLARD